MKDIEQIVFTSSTGCFYMLPPPPFYKHYPPPLLPEHACMDLMPNLKDFVFTKFTAGFYEILLLLLYYSDIDYPINSLLG